MRFVWGCVLVLAACSAEPALGDGTPTVSGDAGNEEEAATTDEVTNPQGPSDSDGCSVLRRQALGVVDAVTSAQVSVVSTEGTVTTLYVDASAGGFQRAAMHPYVYVNLSEPGVQPLTDLDAETSSSWDLAFKRFTIRTNSADSGPGEGGAAAFEGSFEAMTYDDVAGEALDVDDFIDEETCETVAGDPNIGGIATPFSSWYAYEEGTMVVTPLPLVYVVRSADGGQIFKVELLDYYATPDGGRGQVSGRFLLRYAPL